MMTKLARSNKHARRHWTYLQLLVGLAYPGLIGCFDASTSAGLDAEQGALLAKSDVLWPMAGGTATVRVCWTEPRLSSAYPVASLAPDIGARLVVLKQWTREIVEAEWNAKTPLEFTGWEDCTGRADTLELTPIDSATTPTCAAQGQPCVTTLGRALLERKGVFLNLFFGEEVLYSSRYQQHHAGSSYQRSDDVNPDPNLDYQWWLPQACFDELQYPWTVNNSRTKHRVDIENPQIFAEFMAIYANCLKFNVLHEFGHVAGFAHEQQRKDVAAGCDAEVNPDTQYRADTPLGPFDGESIMSYCRTNQAATLSAQDIEQTKAVYRTSGGTNSGGAAGTGGAAGSGGAGGSGSSEDPSRAGATTTGGSGEPSRAGAPSSGAPSFAGASAGTSSTSAGAGNNASTGGAQGSAGNTVSAAPSASDGTTGCALAAAAAPGDAGAGWVWAGASAVLGCAWRRRRRALAAVRPRARPSTVGLGALRGLAGRRS